MVVFGVSKTAFALLTTCLRHCSKCLRNSNCFRLPSAAQGYVLHLRFTAMETKALEIKYLFRVIFSKYLTGI